MKMKGNAYAAQHGIHQKQRNKITGLGIKWNYTLYSQTISPKVLAVSGQNLCLK